MKPIEKINKVLLFNPVSIVHARNMSIFRNFMPDFKLRCIYNPNLPWFSDMEKNFNDEIVYFRGKHFPMPPRDIFNNVGALVLFTSQPRIPPCNLIQEATLRGIPIIAIEEVHQMMLQQGELNNYLLPVDHLFVASDYERHKFAELVVAPETIEVTGCIFRYKEHKTPNSFEKERLKKKFNLSLDKHTSTLCLDALSSETDSLDICKRLISCIAQGLSSHYELLIKPHPEDKKDNFYDLIRKHAPNAKIADPKISIDEVLDVTDILFNRGNSQVIIDALQRTIPVILIPLGKKTFFHGCLDEVIVNDGNLAKVISSIETKGKDLYDEIIRKYLSISPEQAVEKVISRIVQIAKNKEIHRPQERLIELSLFWAWMGYPLQGKKTLSLVQNTYPKKEIIEKIHKLILCKANREEVFTLKEWIKGDYKQWILQSLWIKTVYLSGKKLNSQDKEWLKYFPPKMERLRFLNYAVLLYWCYLKSDMLNDGEVLLNELSKEYGSQADIERLLLNNPSKIKNYYFNINFWRMSFSYFMTIMLKNFLWRIDAFKRSNRRKRDEK